MITFSTVEKILADKAKELSLPVYKEGTAPIGTVTAERVMIHAKEPQPSDYWLKSFCEVNILIPNIDGNANGRRLGEVEALAIPIFKDSGYSNGIFYTYNVYTTHHEEDVDLKCWFVNIKILFKTKNIL